MYIALILALALAAPAMATLPLILTTTSALGVTTATTTLLAAPAVTGLLGAAVIIKGKKVYNMYILLTRSINQSRNYEAWFFTNFSANQILSVWKIIFL